MASQARSMSRSLHRARPQTDEPATSVAMARTASKSPTEAIGNPASMMSTPRAAKARAISSFSAMFMLAPGDCSPSRRVVSKIRTRFASGGPLVVDLAGVVVLIVRLFSLSFGVIGFLLDARPTDGASEARKHTRPRDPPFGRVSGPRGLRSHPDATTLGPPP